MSHEGEEDLLEYSDSEEVTNTKPTTTEGGEEAGESGDADNNLSYFGIHATWFKDFLLKP